MAITAVQETGASANSSSVTKAFASNVTAGNIIIVYGARYTASLDDFVAGDCTKSAGTATIGAVTLDKVANVTLSGSDYIVVRVWSCQVTGSGSCTMQIAGGGASNNIGIGEYHTDVSSIAFGTGLSNNSTGTSTSPSAGNVTTGGTAIIAGAMTNDATVNPETITPDAAFTTVHEEENGSAALSCGFARRITTGNVTDSADWTLGTSAKWVAIDAAYVEATSSVTITPGLGSEPMTGQSLTLGFAVNMPDQA